MAQLRPMLFMGLLVLAYLMWMEWEKDYGVQPQAQPATELANNSSVTNTLDDASIPAPPDNSIPTVGDLPEPDSGTTSMNPDTGALAVMTGGDI